MNADRNKGARGMRLSARFRAGKHLGRDEVNRLRRSRLSAGRLLVRTAPLRAARAESPFAAQRERLEPLPTDERQGRADDQQDEGVLNPHRHSLYTVSRVAASLLAWKFYALRGEQARRYTTTRFA